MAAIVVVSMVAIGGVAALTAVGTLDSPTTLDDGVVAAGGSFPSEGDLASDEYLVDDDYEPGEVADDDQLYPTIQAAVDNASAGYTVYVRDGTYDESVLVDKRLDLVGEGSDVVSVTGNSVALNVTGDDVSVSGFTFVGDSGDNVVEVVGASSSNDVKNFEFTDNEVIVAEDGTGLYHAPMDQDVPSHEETLIQNNVFTVAPGSVSSPTEAEYLIYVDDSGERPHNITINDNDFTSPTDQDENLGEVTTASVHLEANDSTVSNNHFDARADTDSITSFQVVSTGDRNTIADNLVESNWADVGIAADSGTGQDTVVENNNVKNAQLVGILVIDHERTLVDNNKVHHTNGPGVILLNAPESRVTSNDVHDNDEVGVYVGSSDGARVDDNDVVDTNSIGVWVFDSVGVTVEHNLLENNEIGAQVDGSGQLLDSTQTANGDSADVLFENNEFADNADVGLNVSDFDDAAGTDARPQANFNDFSAQDHDVRNGHEDRIDARLNWFGVDDHAITDEASVEGDVLYDPFLTDAPENVDQNPDETEQFAHDFTLDASESTTHVIASPGPGDRKVGDAFADLPSGTQVWAYDNANGQWTQASASDSIHDLDAFVVTGLEEDATVVFGFAGDGQGHVSNADLGEGWNLVSSPRKDAVDPAFEQSAATITSIMHIYEGATDMPAFMNMVDASGDERAWQATFGQNDARCVSPYTGYWVYVDDDDAGGIPSNLADGVSYNDAIDLLRTDGDSYPCGSGSGT